MTNKNNKVLTIVAIFFLLVMIIGATYAFFEAAGGDATSEDTIVTSNTTDLLTFSINQDISFTVTQAAFGIGGQNQSGEATATAILTPNNKTGAATMNYYMYLNITDNPTVYSSTNTNHDPELMLQVFDGNNQLVTLTGLGTQKTIKGVTGYDITGVTGLKTLLNNHAISATNNTTTTENWRVVITLINLDVDQNDNTGKTIQANLIIRQDEMSLGLTGTIYRNNSRVAVNNHTIEDELNNVWCRLYNNRLDCQVEHATQAECEYWGYSCGQSTDTLGVGTYETDINIIRSNTKYYLKHIVENNIIQSTETCLWYNNHEFCVEPGYWVETGNGNQYHDSEENGVATMNKLKSAMETALGTQADDCYSSDTYTYCSFDEDYCYADSRGYVSCQNEHYGCEVHGDSTSLCNPEP